MSILDKLTVDISLLDKVAKLTDDDLIDFVNSDKAKDFFNATLRWPEGYFYSIRSFRYCKTTLRQVLNRALEYRKYHKTNPEEKTV